MHDLPRHTLLQIVAVVGRNQLESARQALHQYLRQFADLMEKLSQRYQLADLSKDLAANQGVYMLPLLLQQPPA
jgi:uncharacterized membrane-anchored protein YhcB (DUF1043 family)